MGSQNHHKAPGNSGRWALRLPLRDASSPESARWSQPSQWSRTTCPCSVMAMVENPKRSPRKLRDPKKSKGTILRRFWQETRKLVKIGSFENDVGSVMLQSRNPGIRMASAVPEKQWVDFLGPPNLESGRAARRKHVSMLAKSRNKWCWSTSISWYFYVLVIYIYHISTVCLLPRVEK